MSSPPHSVLLIDDHALFRAGLKLILARNLQAITLFEAERLSDIVAIRADISVVFLDINLPGINGIMGIDIVKKRWPDAAVIMLTASHDNRLQDKAIARGADLFLHKNATPEAIFQAIDHVLNPVEPEPDPDPEITAETAPDSAPDSAPPPTSDAPNNTANNAANDDFADCPLSPRQRQVLDLLSTGHSNKAIAKQLFISENTVRNHVAGLMRFFTVDTRTEVVFAAQQAGFLSPR